MDIILSSKQQAYSLDRQKNETMKCVVGRLGISSLCSAEPVGLFTSILLHDLLRGSYNSNDNGIYVQCTD